MFTLGIVDGLRVSELAERAGVAASTVRFYERAGLLSPAQRAANGYRMFEESALDELAFIARAKGIGMGSRRRLCRSGRRRVSRGGEMP